MDPIVIEDFISQEDCDFIIEYTNKKNGGVGTYNNPDNIFHWGTDKSFSPVRDNPRMYELTQEIVKNIGDIFQKEFEMKNTFEFKRMFAQTLGIGGSVQVHTDDQDVYDNKPLVEEHYSGLLFLNDDYDGGELHFENSKLTMKPKPRSLVYFKGDAEARHEVFEVTGGKRMNLVIFFRDYIAVD
jgi:hypothetical protein